jgi:hypothetical protein
MKIWMISNDDGAKTSLYCATSPDVAAADGLYYDSCREKTPSALALDDALADRLWDKSVEYTGASLPT